MAKIFYFATLVDQLGIAEEEVQFPNSVINVATLLHWLRTRGPKWQEALAENRVSLTINKQFAALDVQLAQNDEIAIIPLRA